MPSRERTRKYLLNLTSCHPLLPSFPAKLVFALRTLLGIACCTTLTLSPVTSKLIQGQLLLGVSFIVAIQSTLGATIQTVGRIFLASTITTIYCLIIINYFPRDIYFAVGSTNIFVLIIVYTDLPIIVRRFSILIVCIVLLQWFNKPQINTNYVLHTWASLSIAGTLAIIVSCIPLPFLPTAYSELEIRMRFLCQQIQREVTAIILLISEYDQVHSYDKNHNDKRNETMSTMDAGNDDGEEEEDIDLLNDTYTGDIYYHSRSFENLQDDHLLKSDIQDLHVLVNEELKQMERALKEISFEPYFLCMKLYNFTTYILRFIPVVDKYFKKSSRLEARLEVWTAGVASLQRTVTAMLSLDYHHRAFVGQRQSINAIRLLVDSAFQFLNSALSYTIRSSVSADYSFDPEHIASYRIKVEQALDNFFTVYLQSHGVSNGSTMSNTDSIRLNTFLLLILRFVHVVVNVAEKSEMPGTCFEKKTEPTINSFITHLKAISYDLINYIGLKPSLGKIIRAVKTSLSVLVSTIVVLRYREQLQAYDWIYWAPLTTALVSDSSEGGTIRLSFQRLMAVLFGSTFAYIIVLVGQDCVVIGIFISLFIAFMGYMKIDGQKEYFASVCAQSASIITFLFNRGGSNESNKAVLARISLTFLGIFIHVIISNIFLPLSARTLVKKKIIFMIRNVSSTLKSASDDFCSFVEPTTSIISVDQQLSSINLMNKLAEIEQITDRFPSLLDEALSEPNLWRRPFVAVKDHYNEMSKTLRRIVLNIRFIHRSTTILKAKVNLHPAEQLKCQHKQSNVSLSDNNLRIGQKNCWTITDLQKHTQLQNDLDMPLKIFMTYPMNNSWQKDEMGSLFRNKTNTSSYKIVLSHISMLETHIQQVLSLIEQLIDRKVMINTGSFELQQWYRVSINDKQKSKAKPVKTLEYRSSFYFVNKQRSIPIIGKYKKYPLSSQAHQRRSNDTLPSLRNAVNLMVSTLIQFLHANNDFIRNELLLKQSIGDILAFHTLSYAFKDLIEAITDLAKNARRIVNHIDTQTLLFKENQDNST